MDSVCIGYKYIPIINTPDWGLIHIQPNTNENTTPLNISINEIIPTNNPILQPINLEISILFRENQDHCGSGEASSSADVLFFFLRQII